MDRYFNDRCIYNNNARIFLEQNTFKSTCLTFLSCFKTFLQRLRFNSLAIFRLILGHYFIALPNTAKFGRTGRM
jgi:hypothetical protein